MLTFTGNTFLTDLNSGLVDAQFAFFGKNVQSGWVTEGLQTFPLSYFMNIHATKTQPLAHLSTRQGYFSDSDEQPIKTSRFNVCLLNNEVVSFRNNKVTGVACCSSDGAVVNYGRTVVEAALKRLYKSVFLLDNPTMGGKAVPLRNESFIEHAVNHSVSIVLMAKGQGMNLEDNTAVAGISFTTAKPNIAVTSLFAVTPQHYDRRFGEGNDNNPFRRRGIMTFLIVLLRCLFGNDFGYEENDSLMEFYLMAIVQPTDPSRHLFLKAIGSSFCWHSYKWFDLVLKAPISPEFPRSGTEIVYSLRLTRSNVLVPCVPLTLDGYSLVNVHPLLMGTVHALNCNCLSEAHKNLQFLIQCIGCGSYVHPDCCRKPADESEWKICRLYADQFLDGGPLYFERLAKVMDSDQLALVDAFLPVWTFCQSCAAVDKWIPSTACCLCQEDTSQAQPPDYFCTDSFAPIHASVKCRKCNNHVHMECVVKRKVKRAFLPPDMSHYSCQIYCVKCRSDDHFQSESYMPYTEWNPFSSPGAGDTILELPFPVKTSLLFGVLDKSITTATAAHRNDSLCDAFRELLRIQPTSPKKIQNLLIPSSRWLDDVTGKQDVGEIVNPDTFHVRMTVSTLENLCGSDTSDGFVTPALLDVVIYLLHLGRSQSNSNAAKRKLPTNPVPKASTHPDVSCCMPLSFMTAIFKKYVSSGRVGLYELAMSLKLVITKHLFTKRVVFIPFLHHFFKDFGLIVLFNNHLVTTGDNGLPSFVIKDYCEETLFTSARSQVFTRAVFCDFLDIAHLLFISKLDSKSRSLSVILEKDDRYLDGRQSQLSFGRSLFSTGNHIPGNICRSGLNVCHDMIRFMSNKEENLQQLRDVSLSKEVFHVQPLPTYALHPFFRSISDFLVNMIASFAPKYLIKLAKLLNLRELEEPFDRRWSFIKNHMGSAYWTLIFCCGTLPAKREKVPKALTDFKDTVLNDFLVALLYTSARIMYEHTVISGPDLVTSSRCPNNCEMCQTSFVQGNHSFRDITLPKPDSADEWVKFSKHTPKTLHEGAMQELERRILASPYEICVEDVTYITFFDYLDDHHKSVADHVRGSYNDNEDTLFWDSNQVALFLEMFVHGDHVTEGTQLIVTSGESLEAAMQLQLQDLKTPFLVNPATTRILATARLGQHYIVLEIHIETMMIIYYDGQDVAMNLAESCEGMTELLVLPEERDVNTDDLIYYACHLLKALKLVDVTSTYADTVHWIRQRSDLFESNGHMRAAVGKWRLVSIVIQNTAYQQVLIKQKNNHACGAVCVLQTLYLIGWNGGVINPLDLSTTVDVCFSAELCKLGIKQRLRSYAIDCVYSQDNEPKELKSWISSLFGKTKEEVTGTGAATAAKGTTTGLGGGPEEEKDDDASAKKGKQLEEDQHKEDGEKTDKSNKSPSKTVLPSPPSPGRRERKRKRNAMNRKTYKPAELNVQNEDPTEVESIGSDNDNMDLVEKLANWRFPAGGWEEEDRHYVTRVSPGYIPDNLTVVETTVSFPAIKYLHYKYSGGSCEWKISPTGCTGKNELFSVSATFITSLFDECFINRCVKYHNNSIRVLFQDYLCFQHWNKQGYPRSAQLPPLLYFSELPAAIVGTVGNIMSQETRKLIQTEYFWSGIVKNLHSLRYQTFYNKKWLTQEVNAVLTRCRNKIPPVAYCLVPRQPVWFGLVNNSKSELTSQTDYETVVLHRSWLDEHICDWKLREAMEKEGKWQPLKETDGRLLYEKLMDTKKYPTKTLSTEDQALREAEFGMVKASKQVTSNALHQVSHLMYRPYSAKLRDWLKKKLKLDKEITLNKGAGWFFGVTISEPKMGELLESAWVTENINEDFVKYTKLNRGQYKLLPAGKPRELPPSIVARNRSLSCKLKQELESIPLGGECPIVKYHQLGKATCIVDSMASALFWFYQEALARYVHHQRQKSLRKHTNEDKFQLVRDTVERYFPKLTRQVHYYAKGEFEPMNNIMSCPTLAVLEASDGGVQHAVTIYEGWIFDSNEQHALPLCQASLDRCAPPRCVGVIWAARFGRKYPA